MKDKEYATTAEMNKRMNESAFENLLRTAFFNTPCKQIHPLSRIKTLHGPKICGISPVGKEKVYGEKDLQNNQVVSSEWKTGRVREDEIGDTEHGEDDELPCVIG